MIFGPFWMICAPFVIFVFFGVVAIVMVVFIVVSAIVVGGIPPADGRENYSEALLLNIVPLKRSFVKITSGNVEKRLKNPKNLKNFRKRPNASNCFRMHPNASQWVRMDPKASKSSRKPQKTCENFEKLRKNFEKLRENFYKNFFHGVVIGNCFQENLETRTQP